ncbi:MAG: acetate/propionate family kinase [Burkholderiaceae bacterium]
MSDDSPWDVGAYVLAVNAGSSSIRFALYDLTERLLKRVRGKIERIGLRDATFTVDGSIGARAQSRSIDADNHSVATFALINWLEEAQLLSAVKAVGHRMVHGGSRYSAPERINDDLVRELRRISEYASEHLPAEIELVERFRQRLPDIQHVACFDTAFHHDMPRVAQLLPIPRRFSEKGVRRFGFHGLSYQFLIEELERTAGTEAAHGRVILAHLGNGSSLAAVSQGKSVDTTMAFTPAAGVPMSTRSGDLDPGLAWYFAQSENMSAEQFHRMVNHESGLLGVSETSSDIRDLLAREVADVRAAEAVALYCYQVAKSIGAFAVVLGGLDTLVFAGGIGENSPVIRHRICERLGFLGVALDDRNNATNEALISAHASAVAVRMIRTDEEAMIARATQRVLRGA